MICDDLYSLGAGVGFDQASKVFNGYVIIIDDISKPFQCVGDTEINRV